MQVPTPRPQIILVCTAPLAITIAFRVVPSLRTSPRGLAGWAVSRCKRNPCAEDQILEALSPPDLRPMRQLAWHCQHGAQTGTSSLPAKNVKSVAGATLPAPRQQLPEQSAVWSAAVNASVAQSACLCLSEDEACCAGRIANLLVRRTCLGCVTRSEHPMLNELT